MCSITFTDKQEKRFGRLALISLVGISVTAVSLLLAGCGNPPTETTTPTPPTGQTGATLTATTTSARLVQPKVVDTGTDARGGKIEFTETPILNDGIPALLFFETEN